MANKYIAFDCTHKTAFAVSILTALGYFKMLLLEMQVPKSGSHTVSELSSKGHQHHSIMEKANRMYTNRRGTRDFRYRDTTRESGSLTVFYNLFIPPKSHHAGGRFHFYLI